MVLIMRGNKSSSPAKTDLTRKSTKRSDSSSSLSSVSMHLPKSDSPTTRSSSRNRSGLGRGISADADDSSIKSSIYVDSDSSEGPEIEVIQMPVVSKPSTSKDADSAQDKSLESSPPSPSLPSSSSTLTSASSSPEKPKRQRKRKARKMTLAKPKPKPKDAKSPDNSVPKSVSLKHPVTLVVPRTRVIGPVIRISAPPKPVALRGRPRRPSASIDSLRYTIINKEQKQLALCPTIPTKPDSSNRIEIVPPTPIRDKNRATKLYNHMVDIQKKPKSEWMCALCQRGAMVEMMGDLYGPYYVELCPIPQVIPRANVSTPTRGRTRAAFSRSPAVPHLPPLSQPERLEVWLHEDCVVWSNATYVGGRLENIGEVIEDARRSLCNHCKSWGATLSCKGHNCPTRTLHYPCARDLGCFFDEPVHNLYCKMHINEYMRQRLAADPAGLSQQPWPQQYLKLR